MVTDNFRPWLVAWVVSGLVTVAAGGLLGDAEMRRIERCSGPPTHSTAIYDATFVVAVIAAVAFVLGSPVGLVVGTLLPRRWSPWARSAVGAAIAAMTAVGLVVTVTRLG